MKKLLFLVSLFSLFTLMLSCETSKTKEARLDDCSEEQSGPIAIQRKDSLHHQTDSISKVMGDSSVSEKSANRSTNTKTKVEVIEAPKHGSPGQKELDSIKESKRKIRGN